MDGWLAYHAAFVACITAALYRCGTDPRRLAADRLALTLMCQAITEAFAALHASGVGGLPRNLAVLHKRLLRMIAVRYWARTMRSPMGELCFAGHARHAEAEMRAIAMTCRPGSPARPPSRNSSARAILAAHDLLGHGDPADAVSDVNRFADTGTDIGDIDQAGQGNHPQYLAPRRGQQQSTAPMPSPSPSPRQGSYAAAVNEREAGQINDDPGSPGRCRRERSHHVRSISNVELPVQRDNHATGAFARNQADIEHCRRLPAEAAKAGS
jgi:hypothetical protein